LTAKDLKTVRALLRSGDVPISTIAEQFRVARSTLYRNVTTAA
jgi:predicted transcriptional regulator